MRALMICLSLACLAGAAPAVANEHATQPASSASRWQAEPVLAAHMKEVGVAVDDLAHYKQGHVGPAQGVALATIIEDHVNQIIANCKLPPEQDARLHAIIAPLLANAGALKTAPKRLELIEPMRKAMQDYRTAFASPGQG